MSVKTKEVEVSTLNACIVFNFKYLGSKYGKRVFKKAMERTLQEDAQRLGLSSVRDENVLSFAIVEAEREAGYLNQAYPIENEHYKELSRIPISYEDLIKHYE